jgi:hypothetical protein
MAFTLAFAAATGHAGRLGIAVAFFLHRCFAA